MRVLSVPVSASLTREIETGAEVCTLVGHRGEVRTNRVKGSEIIVQRGGLRVSSSVVRGLGLRVKGSGIIVQRGGLRVRG